jgi:hypothetical protein
MATDVEPADWSIALPSGRAGGPCIRVGLIDGAPPQRDHLIRMLTKMHPDLHIVPFPHVAACIDAPAERLDVILYCDADNRSSLASILENVTLLREALGVPVVVVPARGASAQRGEVGKAATTTAPRPPQRGPAASRLGLG